MPTPELAGAPALEGTTLTFTLVNPDPQDGDRFVWRPDPAPDEGFRRIDGDTVSITVEGIGTLSNPARYRDGAPAAAG